MGASAAFGTSGNAMTVDPFKPTINAATVNQNQAQAAKMGISIPGSTEQPAQTTLAQDQAKAQNQGQPGFDVLGNPVTTPTTTTSSTGTNQNSTGTSTGTTTDSNQQALSDAQAARAQADAEYQAQAKQVSDTITNIQNGTTPLTPGQQAQIDGLKAQFQTFIDAQTLKNTGAQGTANIRGYQTGAAEYDPTFQVKTIGSIITAGQNKIADLNTKMAAAVAQMTQSFQTNDIKAVTDAWNIYKDAADKHATELQKTVDDAQAAIKAAQDAAKNSQDEADKLRDYNLNVQKFQQTGDQNAFDQAFKLEQQKYTEQKDAATAAETARHNKADEAINAFKAGMGAGGGGNIPNVPAAQIGANGNPDPVSQKAVLDGITQQYGPATALAIKSLADYSMNPSDWSVRSGKGMTREEAVTLAKQYDPTYSDANYPIRAGYMKSIASTQTGTVGAAVNSANKAINHLTSFVTTMNKLNSGPGTLPGGFGQSQFGNAVTNFISTPFNPGRSTDISTAQTEGLGVADELAKFFKGTGSTDVGSIDAWKGQVNTNSTPAQVKGMTQGAIDLLSGQLSTLAEQYQSTMGKAPTSDFLNPSARASLSSLKNQGYEVNIPGINYTDKGAWQNNGGTQDQWNSAVDALTKAGMPLTQENILQYAQEQ